MLGNDIANIGEFRMKKEDAIKLWEEKQKMEVKYISYYRDKKSLQNCKALMNLRDALICEFIKTLEALE